MKTYKVVYFSPTEGLSFDDAEAAKQVNGAQVAVGIKDVRPPVTGPMGYGLLGEEVMYHVRKATPAQTFIHHVERYHDGSVNAFLHTTAGPVGLIRVREE